MIAKAIIDIGTNAVRGVVYTNNSLGALEVANTQFSHNFYKTGYKARSLFPIMDHYKKLFYNLKVTNIKLVGTAAMRAGPTEIIIQDINKKYNFNINVLTGKQEAEYVGRAIDMSIYNASGVIADLGGGSLEMSCIKNHKIFNIISIDIQNTNNIIKNIKNTFNFESAQVLDNLYLVGGGFRLLIKQYAYTMKYPTEIISHYLSIPAQQLLNYIFHINDIHNKTHNIIVQIIENLNVKNIIISNYGLKEGVHFAEFENKKYIDFMMEKTYNITQNSITEKEIVQYSSILQNLIPLHSKQYMHLLKIALMFVKINKCVNYIHKSSVFFDWILKINLPFSSQNRIMIYIIIQNVFSYNYEHPSHLKLISMLSNEQLYIAKIYGSLLNITYTIHGCFAEQLDYKIIINNKHAFIECSSILHSECFNKILYSTKKINELIKKLYIKKSQNNYKYDNMIV